MAMTRLRKFGIWELVFAQNPVKPGANVLDLGCGRGAVLLQAAKFLGDEGRSVGIDMWQRRDQSGNDMDAAERNAELAGVNGWWGGPWMSTRVIVAQK